MLHGVAPLRILLVGGGPVGRGRAAALVMAVAVAVAEAAEAGAASGVAGLPRPEEQIISRAARPALVSGPATARCGVGVLAYRALSALLTDVVAGSRGWRFVVGLTRANAVA